MSSTRSSNLPSKKICLKWLKQPQVSIKGTPYKIGDLRPGTEWATSYIPCHKYIFDFYGDDIMKPLQILKFVENAGLRNDREVEKIEAVLTNFEKFQKYISSCILAYGILLSEQHKSIFRKPISMIKHELQEFYEEIYNIYIRNHRPSQEELESIVEPENFLKLADPDFKDRLKKSGPKVNLPNDVCVADHNKECVAAFREIPETAPLYSLANSIKCLCDIFRTHVTLVNPDTLHSIEINYYVKDINKVSEQDFLNISEDLSTEKHVERMDRRIDIELKSSENCVNNPMFYLNQIRDKLYEPYLLTAQNRLKELFRSYIRQLEEIEEEESGEIIYVMDPPILINFYKLNDRNQKVYDQVVGPGPVINLFDDIAQELVQSKIFIPKESIFGTERYIINPSKTYDYEYIGMLFRYLLINRIRIPFKLSRAYICKLFGLCQFNINTRNIYEQLILISIYILEKGTYFKELMIKIFKNPELLKDKTFCEESGVFSYPAQMNDFETIVTEDRYIYNDDQTVLLYNIVQFLYKNAVKDYFETDNVHNFFENFGEVDIFREYAMNIEMAQGNNIAIAFPIPKLDLYMSGTSISMTEIQTILVPKIQKHIIEYVSHQELNNHYGLLINVLINSTNYFSERFKEAYDATFEPPQPLTKEQYHLEFVKYLLKFWTGSSHISELYYYGIQLLPGSPRTRAEYLLPKAATCSQEIKLRKRYETPEVLYEDLVSSIIESSFGKEFGVA